MDIKLFALTTAWISHNRERTFLLVLVKTTGLLGDSTISMGAENTSVLVKANMQNNNLMINRYMMFPFYSLLLMDVSRRN